MKMRIFYLVFAILLLNIFSLGSYAAEDKVSSDERSKGAFYVEMKDKGLYIKRGKNFHLGNVGNWGGGVTGNVLYLHDFDMDRLGAGYEFVVGTTKNMPVRLEGSFEQYFVSIKKVKQDIIGIGAGDLSVMPFIDSSFGTLSKGFFITAAVPVGVNAPGNLTLKYGLEYRSWHVNTVMNFFNKGNFVLDLFVGPIYSRFSQHYKVDTAGTNPGGGLTFSSTSESLIDNLFGPQMGAKGKIQLSKKLSLGFSEAVDLFYRHSEFKGTQDITNGANLDTTNLDTTLKISRRNTGFVPHLASNINLVYLMSRNTSINFFYQFDFWNNLTMVKNPVLTADQISTTGSAGIARENVLTHAIGVSTVIMF